MRTLDFTQSVGNPYPRGEGVVVTTREFLPETVAAGPCGFPLSSCLFKKGQPPSFGSLLGQGHVRFPESRGPLVSLACPLRGCVWLGCPGELSRALAAPVGRAERSFHRFQASAKT